jgi:2-polyprenyl-3-methyl-5-hydroxy-6-metoxy-1,4-benzoquinol methylase
MDDPDCDEALLFRTLDQFASINRWFSQVRPLLRKTVLRDMRRQPERVWHLVDLGAGACDIPVWLLSESGRLGLKLCVTAIDADPRAVEYAQVKHAKVPGLRIQQGDARDLATFAPFDFLFGNHFLHHLDDVTLATVLSEGVRLTGKRLVFSDLRRSPLSHAAFSFVARLYQNSFAREDGLLSIRKGFRVGELRALLAAAGAPATAHVYRALPGRVIIDGTFG